MADPFLFESMHGITSKKSKKDSLPIAKSDDAVEKSIQKDVDRLMSLENPSGNSLLPPEARRTKIEQEVRAAADCSEFGKYMAAAYQLLTNEASAYLEKEENETLQQHIDQLCKQLENLDLNDLSREKLQTTTLAMPEEGQKAILKIGIAKFTEGLPEDSLAIFTFLSALDENQPNYSYRLGLAAQKAGNYTLALKALKTTSDLAPDFIGAHLFAAECYYQNGMLNEALSELKEAKDILKTTGEKKEWSEHVLEIESLLVQK